MPIPNKSDLDAAVSLMTQGVAFLNNRQEADALTCLNQALTIVPHFPSALVKRAMILQALNRHQEAIDDLDHCLKVKPDMPQVHSLREFSFHAALGILDASTDEYTGSAKVKRLCERAILLLRLRRDDEAIETIRQILALEQCHGGALNTLGNVLMSMNRPDDALACYERILLEDHSDGIACFNRGNALQKNGRYREAIISYDAMLALRPGMPEALIEQAHCHLALGELQEGWALFEARWDTDQLRGAKLRTDAPMWDGSVLAEKQILLLWAEQGFGDTIQFVRYLQMVMHRAAHIVLRVPGSLCSLMQGMTGIEHNSLCVIGSDELLPQHDFHCPLMSLPWIFNTTLQSVPANIPYLQAHPDGIARWEKILGQRSKPRIGLVWAGGQRLLNNPTRDMPLELLRPLFDYEADWISLQKSMSATDLPTVQTLPQLRCLGDELADFNDTAALISCLDLVISIDSAVAHLAGALGKPVLLMLRKSGEWRWMAERSDSPWYPSHKLFRQSRHGVWANVVQEIAHYIRFGLP